MVQIGLQVLASRRSPVHDLTSGLRIGVLVHDSKGTVTDLDGGFAHLVFVHEIDLMSVETDSTSTIGDIFSLPIGTTVAVPKTYVFRLDG